MPAKKRPNKPTKKQAVDFWKLVDAHRRASGACDLHGLEAALGAMSTKDILAFQHWLYERLNESYRGDLWAAAYLVNGGCSDDGFDYFRAWLISRGQKVYDAALANPDSLIEEVGDGEVELEEILTVASRAWKRKTGKDDYYDRLDEAETRAGRDDSGVDIDLSWADDDGEGVPKRLKKLCPKLFAKFG